MSLKTWGVWQIKTHNKSQNNCKHPSNLAKRESYSNMKDGTKHHEKITWIITSNDQKFYNMNFFFFWKNLIKNIN